MINTARLAATYIQGKGCRPTPVERETFRNWLCLQFARIADRVQFTDDEVTPEQMLAFHAVTGDYLISTAHNIHPHWTPRENAMFRAVHDHQHVIGECGFDMEGEMQAFEIAADSAPKSIGWILYSEIALQAAASIHTGSFQRQKLVRC